MAAKGKNSPRPVDKQPAAAPRKQAAASAAAPPLGHLFAPNFWQQNWLPISALMLLPFALYAQAIAFGYVLDDQMVIWDNIYVQKGFGGLRDIFAYDSFMGYFKEQKFLLEGGRYRPLSLATFAVEVGIFGKDHPAIGHFINILLYGATGVLLYRILHALFPLREGGRWFFGLPFLGAIIFLLHPLHVEVVANIKGRDEILALLGSLGALWAALKYADTAQTRWLWWSALWLFLGCMAKENALTFVVAVPLTLWFFTKTPRSRVFFTMLPLAAASLLFLLIRSKALGYTLNHGISVTDLMNNPFVGMAGGEKFATIFLTLGWYLKLLFVPHPLTHDYYPYHVPKVGWGDWRALVSLAIYVGMGAWAIWQMRRARRDAEPARSGQNMMAWAVLFFLATLSIVSNLFVSVGTFMNERFAFMPSVAFCVLAGWFLARKLPEILREPNDRPYLLGAGLAVLVLALSAARVWTRVPDWKDALSLNSSSVRTSPESCRSHCFYVTAIYENIYNKLPRESPERARWVDSMEVHVEKSLEIYPKYSAALQMKAAVAAARFEQDKQMDKLFHAWSIVLERSPNNTQTRDFLGKYMKYLQGRGNPNKYATFCHRIGYEFYFKEKRDIKSALEYLNYGIEIQTEDTRVLEDLAEVYQAAGDGAKAAEMRRRAEASKNL